MARRRILALTLTTALFLWTFQAHASLTRLQSMGANPGGMGMVQSAEFVDGALAIDDSSNVFALPGTLALYPNIAIMDNLSWSDDVGATGMFGFHYALEEYTVMALYGGQGRSALASSRPGTLAGGANALEGANGVGSADGVFIDGTAEGQSPDLSGNLWFGILFAHDFGGLRLGASVQSYTDNQQTTLPEPQAAEMSNWLMDVDLGLGLDFDTEDSLDFGLGLRFGSLKYTGPTTFRGEDLAEAEIAFYTPYTNFGFDFMGRGQFQLTEGTELIPYGHITYEIEGVTDEFEVDPADPAKLVSSTQPKAFGDYSHFGLEIGMALKLTPGDKISIYPGLGFRTDTYSVDNRAGSIEDDMRVSLPYYGFGVDARVWNWFAVRFGARQYVLFDTDASTIDEEVTETLYDADGNATTTTSKTTVEQESKVTRVTTNMQMGFGLFFGENDEWQIDVQMSPAFFVKGPYILSGATTTVEGGAEQMNASVAVQYLW